MLKTRLGLNRMLYDLYQKDLENPDFHYDPAQEKAVMALQGIFDELCAPQKNITGGSGFFSRLFGYQSVPVQKPVRGLYLWGGVGRGKTYLVDRFFENLPFEQKRRIHFHRFMQGIHFSLKEISNQQNPLDAVAEKFARESRVICLDEFYVSDITDAMLLAGLLDALFEKGVCLITTSNIVPDNLYKNGLQRARFLPAIALIKQHMNILNVDGDTDYRLRFLEQAKMYHCPAGPDADVVLADSFDHVATEAGDIAHSVEINGRLIPTLRMAEGIVWFDFDAICDGPRSQNDYIEIARQFHTVLISDVRVMDTMSEDPGRRFVNMVDEFYDRNVKLIMSAQAPIDNIYTGSKANFEFRRTRSRLHEMQSHEYLAKPHLP